MNRIAFTLPDVGLREIRGLAYVDEGFLVLRIQNALFGEFDREEQVVKIAPEALREIWVRRGLLRDRLVLKPHRADLLDVLPGEHRSAVELRVSRRQRADLEALVDEFETLA